FFFQAEDGIRDLIVTGVQTCALPISSVKLSTSRQIRNALLLCWTAGARSSSSAPIDSTPTTRSRLLPSGATIGGRCAVTESPGRSEERRVGKACRCRVWLGRDDKKQR